MNRDMLRLAQLTQFENGLSSIFTTPLSEDFLVATAPTFIQAVQIRHALENKSYECAFSSCKQPQGR